MASPLALDKWGKDYQFHQVGTGPYEFVEWKKDGAPRVSDSRRGLEGLNVEVSAQPPERPPGHAELVKNTYRRIDWLSHYDLLGVRPAASHVRRRL